MGCCGHDFESKEAINKAIRLNTEEYQQYHPKSKEEFLAFRDRKPAEMLREGVCFNLIEENGRFLCPLHPAQRKIDLRIGHCDENYLCPTAKAFWQWDESTQKRFLELIEAKEIDKTEYSLLMDNNGLLKEFELRVLKIQKK